MFLTLIRRALNRCNQINQVKQENIFGSHKNTWKDNIQTDLMKVEREDLD
jgi:hypothetical protein